MSYRCRRTKQTKQTTLSFTHSLSLLVHPSCRPVTNMRATTTTTTTTTTTIQRRVSLSPQTLKPCWKMRMMILCVLCYRLTIIWGLMNAIQCEVGACCVWLVVVTCCKKQMAVVICKDALLVLSVSLSYARIFSLSFHHYYHH